MKRSYIWTALTQRIKAGVGAEGVTETRGVWTSLAAALMQTITGHAPPTWPILVRRSCSLFWIRARTDSDHRQ